MTSQTIDRGVVTLPSSEENGVLASMIGPGAVLPSATKPLSTMSAPCCAPPQAAMNKKGAMNELRFDMVHP